MTGAPHSSVARYRELARHPRTESLDRELLLDGIHLLVEARRSGLRIESAAFESRSLDDPAVREFAETLASAHADVYIVSPRTLEKMSPVKTPSGVVGIARRSLVSVEPLLAMPDPLLVVAHDIQDPGNVGAIVRTAEAAGATGLVVTGSTADPFGWKALRGSMGSALRLPIARASLDDVLRLVASKGIAAIALDVHGNRSVFDADLAQPLALLLGSEGLGLPDEVLDRVPLRLTIPMRAPVESLNVGVAAAVVMYEACKQRAVHTR